MNMPSKRFWAMEAQIGRIEAGEDLRKLRVSATGGSKEGYETLVKSLSLEIGEPYKVKHEIYVKPDPDVKQKFAALMR